MKYPVIGTITSKFGNRIHPVSKISTFHNGVDIAVPVGTEIKSPLAGKVVNVYENEAGGKQLIIDHDNGMRTGYAHLSGYKVARGQRIKEGQVVALSGNTGKSTGPHLHLTLTVNGNKVDPQSYFS